MTTGCRQFHDNDTRQPRTAIRPGWLWALTLVALAAGSSACANDQASGAMFAADEADGGWVMADAQSTHTTGAGNTDETDSGGGTRTGSMDAMTGDAGGAPETNGDKASIGLKPGGAQDIALFRHLVALGKVPAANQMTIEGWLNEHDTLLPAASPDRPIDLHALAGLFTPSADLSPEIAVQIGFNSALSADELLTEKVAMAVVVDRSGSMHGERIERLRATLRDLTGALPEATWFSLVAFGAEAEVIWGPALLDAQSVAALHAAIDTLEAGGGTNLAAGLSSGLAALEQPPAGYTARHLLLFSDGAPTVGVTNPQEIIALGSAAAQAKTTISTVAIGADADTQLLLALVGKGGAAISVGDLSTLPARVAAEVLTLLPPVVDSLWLQFELADGFHSPELYGFELTDNGSGYTVRSLDDDGATTVPTDGDAATPNGDAYGPDVGETPPDAGGGPIAGLPSLHAAHSNGVLMLRLAAPAGMSVGEWAQLTLAKVRYGYHLAASGASHEHEVAVLVPGLVQIADGGLAYFASPIVRRSFALLQAGLAMRKAAGRFHSGHPAEAVAILVEAITFVEAQQATLGAAHDSDAALGDALQLLHELKSLM